MPIESQGRRLKSRAQRFGVDISHGVKTRVLSATDDSSFPAAYTTRVTMRLVTHTSRRPQVASRVSVAQRGRALPVVRAALLPDASEQLKDCKVLVAGAAGRTGK